MGAALAESSQSAPVTKGAGPGAAGDAGGGHAQPAWRRWLRLRGAWLAAALGLAAMAVTLAVALPLRQDVHRPANFPDPRWWVDLQNSDEPAWRWLVGRLLIPRWWIEPQEANAFARLPVVTNGLRSIAIAPDGRLALAVGWGGTLLRSTDAGATWQPVTSGTQQILNRIAIAPDGRLALAVGDNGTLLRSTDAGATWQPVTSGTQQTLGGIAIAPDGRLALAVGWGGTLLRSTDAGATWQPVTSGTQQTLGGIAIAPDGRLALAVGDNGTLLRSTDAGATWQNTHQRSPAPIVWVLLAAAFISAAPLFWPLPAEIRRRSVGSLSDLFATDRPLQPGEKDAAGAGLLAKRLCRFFMNRHTQPPLTLAITGDWGSGKSSVLNLLAAELRQSGRRPVWFNAWHHQKEEHLFAALLQAVRQQAVPPVTTRAGLAVRARLAWSRIRRRWLLWLGAVMLIAALLGAMSATEFPSWSEAWKAIRSAAPDNKDPNKTPLWKEWTAALLAPGTALAVFLQLVGTFRDRLKTAGLDPGRLMAVAAGTTRWRDLGGQLAFRVRFAEALQEVTAALGNNNLTILIDDLDRCDPRAVAEVMEAVNFLTSSGNCFVVMAVARPQVLKAMGLAHAEMAKEMAPEGMHDEREIRDHYAQRYLDKLIQIEMPVPKFDAEAARRLAQSATELRASSPDRAWVAAFMAFALVVLLGVVGVGGHYAWRGLQPPAPLPTQATPLPQATAPAPAPSPSTGPAAPERTTQAEAERGPAMVFPEPASPWRDWRLLLLGMPLVMAGMAAILYARRRPAVIDEEDARDFAKALDHWSQAAFMARPSPREMKRFLNRLRLAATDPAVPADATTVGLATIAQVDRTVLEEYTRKRRALDEAGWSNIGGRGSEFREKWAYVQEAIEGCRNSSDPSLTFAPTYDRVEKFLGAWTGFVIRA